MKNFGLCLISVLMFGLCSYPVHAGEFPEKPIEFIVPFGAGGNSDTTARICAQKAQEILGQPMVVLNKPGAGGALALSFVAKAKPDGYTIALSGTNLAMGKAVNPGVGYHPVDDFAAVSNLITQAVFLCVRSDSKIKTLAQYIEEAKKNPGQIAFGSSGVGGSTYFAGQYFKSVAGIDITNVPYKTGVMMNLLGGHVDSVFSNTPDVLPHVKAGKIRALAITTLERFPELPDVPTVAESGFPGFQVVSWNGVTAPANTPPEVVSKLADYFKQVLQDPEVASKLSAGGAMPTQMGPEEFGQWIKNEYEKWSGVAKDLNIQMK
ncbi:MAG: tripartite tricarboxylate transporter substrate binding protein [Desulfobacterales bacterium]|jgi:tripartite-type tricarboxylate transporter receptor subunit TctC